MIGPRDLLPSQRIHPRCDSLRLRAVVHEHERRSRLTNVLQHELCYRWPDASTHLAEIRHRRHDGDLHRLYEPAVDDRHRPELRRRTVLTCRAHPAQEVRNLLERSLRCR